MTIRYNTYIFKYDSDYDRTKRDWPPTCPHNETLDRISDLPDSLLLHILSFLPMHEAIRTLTLSKRWQYIWMFVDSLIFYDSVRKFTTFVDKAIALSKCSNINKFAVYFTYHIFRDSHFDNWLSFAIKNSVKQLDLNFCSDPRWRHDLPQIVNCIESLESMKLRNCLFVPSGIVYWKSLKSLTLDFVKLNNDSIGIVLSGSPVLEFLALKNFCGFNRLDVATVSLKKLVLDNYDYDYDRKDKSVLEISAPYIQSLDILGAFYRKRFRLINVSSLVNANFNFTFYYGGVCTDDDHQVLDLLREVLESLRHVKELKLGNWCLQVLAIMEVKGFGFSFSSCKCLTLDTEITRWDIPGISSLLRSSPNLETLIVNLNFRREIGFLCSYILDSYGYDGYEYWTSRKSSGECLLHLKAVKFIGVTEIYCENKFAFAKFLLKNTRFLERMDFISERIGCNPNMKCFWSCEFHRSDAKVIKVSKFFY